MVKTAAEFLADQMANNIEIKDHVKMLEKNAEERTPKKDARKVPFERWFSVDKTNFWRQKNRLTP